MCSSDLTYQALSISCAEWRELVEDFPAEMEVIMDMLIEAEVEICK